MLTSINIPTGLQGATMSDTLHGNYFVVGSTTVTIDGTDVTPSMVNTIDTQTLSMLLTINAGAAIGPRNIRLTTPNGASNPIVFTVVNQAGSPTLTSMDPASARQGLAFPVSMIGTGFVVGATTVAVSGSGISTGIPNVQNSTGMTVSFSVDASAPLGPRDVTVSSTNGTSNILTFTVGSQAQRRQQMTSQ
jgi:hypothetical protein